MRALKVFIIFSACILIASCESQNESESVTDQSNRAARATISNSTTVEPESTNLSELPEGESRAIRGQKIQKTPPYVGHVFSPIRPLNPNWTDPLHNRLNEGRLSGFSLHLDNHHAIMHDDSGDSLQPSKGDPKTHHLGSHIMVPTPEKVHVNYQGHAIRGFGDDYPAEKLLPGKLGGSNFELRRLIFKTDPKILAHPTDHPILERNHHEFGTDCHMFTYSDTGRSRSSLFGTEKPNGEEQDMVKIHVNKLRGDCDKGSCRMKVNWGESPDAKVCTHKQDKGAPIMCGPQKKVTYLAHHTGTGGGGCHQQFSAFHVPHLIADVERHVKLN